MINNHRDRAQSHARPQGHWTSRVTSIGSLLVSYIQYIIIINLQYRAIINVEIFAVSARQSCCEDVINI